MNFFFVIFKIGHEFHTYCVVRTKNPPLSTIFKIFRQTWPKKSDVHKITTLLGKMKNGPHLRVAARICVYAAELSVRVKHFTEKYPHLASNDFDTIFL